MQKPIYLKKELISVLLIPLFFILDVSNKFYGFVNFNDLFILFLWFSFISVIAFIVFLKAYQKVNKATIIFLWIQFYYFFFSALFDYFKSNLNAGFAAFFVFSFVVTCLIFFWINKAKSFALSRLLTYLKVLFSVLILIEVVSNIQKQLISSVKNVKMEQNVLLQSKVHTGKPDIYLILLDEYAGFESLAYYFNFANLDFKVQLQQMGFSVGKNTSSNYDHTLQSVLSLLNMSYLDETYREEWSEVNFNPRTIHTIGKNTFVDFLKQEGYQIINHSFLPLSEFDAPHEFNMPYGRKLILGKTFGSFLFNDVPARYFSNRLHFLINSNIVKTLKYNNRVLSDLENNITGKPSFSFSHLMMPHYPYLYNANGQLNNFRELFDKRRSGLADRFYIDYLKYCNAVVLKKLTQIIEKNPKAVIIIMSDHGFRYGKNHIKKYDFNNLIAVRSGGAIDLTLIDSLSNVNLLRVLLNRYFDQSLPLLPNRHVSVTDRRIELPN